MLNKLKQLNYRYYIGLRPKRPLGLVGIVIVAITIVFGLIFILRAPQSAEAEWPPALRAVLRSSAPNGAELGSESLMILNNFY
jgi:hypothetical protein